MANLYYSESASRATRKLSFLTILLALLLMVRGEALADISSGWRTFNLGIQEGLSDGLFMIERLEFLRPADLVVKIKIKNVGNERASLALSIALFDTDKNLLTATNVSLHPLWPMDEEHASVELPGSGEVFPRIEYYQVSLIKRLEK